MTEKGIAVARFKHDGRQLRAGDEFEATPEDLADLVAMGMAERPKGSMARRRYQRRDMKAEN